MIYLDHGATSFPKPEEVYVAMDTFHRTCAVNPGRSGSDLARQVGARVDETRALLAALVNGRVPDRLCFTSNATDAANLVLQGLLRPGDHVVTTVLEHNSVLRPLHLLSQDRGVTVDHVGCDGRGFVDPDEIARRIRPRTRLVVANHASNVLGTVQPAAEIGRRCREAGVTFVLDASQTAGVVPVDVVAMHAGVVFFTGHKSLLGPTGIGGVYVAEGVDVAITRAGGTGVRSAARAHLPEYPYRLEYGTLNALGVVGLQAGVRWLLARGIGAVHAEEMRLLTLLRDGLRDLPGVTMYCQDDLDEHIAVLPFNVEGFEAGETEPLFDVDHDIACRTGLHCAPLVHEHLGTADSGGTVRFSLGPFNTEEHVRAAVAAAADVAALGRKRRR